ncbi:phosphoinositide phosphatase SAC1 [Plasmodium cynomolgi strain B]|uniref:Phosphoinositide phosphatase SAC1 n=1 Tax=Plasmodium cynomolgi (strain B) TaxID=1120755 RepID=K6UXK8_PLACD|nr:phosphoinositide phosphatase SAC1 [Plasmodium cynomolgi strain B]GAB67240.1 phosphoinositide phosphatase SAC1 [Plasmodium cynomolgi strain B]
MANGSVLPAPRYYLESHGNYLSIVNVENNVRNILKISHAEDLQIVKEKQKLTSISDNSYTENENKKKFPFFGCLGIVKAEHTNFLVIVSDAEVVSYLFNRAIYRVKKISFIQLNAEEEGKDKTASYHNYQYEICCLGSNAFLTPLNSNHRKEGKKFFCNKKKKTQNHFDNLFEWSNFLFQNPTVKNTQFRNNSETYIHKLKNCTLKKDTLKTIAYFSHAFNKGPFYFSYHYNLTASLQRHYITESEREKNRGKSPPPSVIGGGPDIYPDDCKYQGTKEPIFHKLQFKEINNEYTWNWKLLHQFIPIDAFEFVVFLIHGYINSNVFHVPNGKLTLYLISRKNKNRSGVRFWCRGGNDKGDVANFVETEQILVCKDAHTTKIFSYIIVRGSIPVLWKQEPTLSLRPKIQICSDMQENAKTVNLHMQKLKNTYGKISITNLNNKQFGEKYLGQCYGACLKECSVEHNYTWFDFHSEFKKLNYQNLHTSLKTVIEDLNDFSFFSVSFPSGVRYNLEHGDEVGGEKFSSTSPTSRFPSWTSAKVDTFQKGVFRVNCVDCLDRTNVFQSFLAKYVLHMQLRTMHIKLEQENKFPFYLFKNTHDELLYRQTWIHNANAISIIYSGAGALKNDITKNGKRTIGGLLQDLFHIVQRYINNNFLDGYNNDCIHLAISENLKYQNVFNVHKGKYNQMMNVILEFIFFARFSFFLSCLICQYVLKPLNNSYAEC